eukprot:SAG11_NODE_3251_length_2580_cov_3.804111_3_plen_75_part_00
MFLRRGCQMAIDTITLCFLEEKTLIDKAVDVGRQVIYSGPVTRTPPVSLPMIVPYQTLTGAAARLVEHPLSACL